MRNRERHRKQQLWWDTFIGARNNGASLEEAREQAYRRSRLKEAESRVDGE